MDKKIELASTVREGASSARSDHQKIPNSIPVNAGKRKLNMFNTHARPQYIPQSSAAMLPAKNLVGSKRVQATDRERQQMHKCCYCRKQYSKHSDLTFHLLTHTAVDQSRYSYAECESPISIKKGEPLSSNTEVCRTGLSTNEDFANYPRHNGRLTHLSPWNWPAQRFELNKPIRNNEAAVYAKPRKIFSITRIEPSQRLVTTGDKNALESPALSASGSISDYEELEESKCSAELKSLHPAPLLIDPETQKFYTRRSPLSLFLSTNVTPDIDSSFVADKPISASNGVKFSLVSLSHSNHLLHQQESSEDSLSERANEAELLAEQPQPNLNPSDEINPNAEVQT